jgi:hypothetical protein
MQQSAARTRLALERKFGANVALYGGAVSLLTLTPPGQETSRRSSPQGRMVEYPYREVWNWSAQARASRLFEAAQRATDRFIRRQLGRPAATQVGKLRTEPQRGVWHFTGCCRWGARSNERGRAAFGRTSRRRGGRRSSLGRRRSAGPCSRTSTANSRCRGASTDSASSTARQGDTRPQVAMQRVNWPETRRATWRATSPASAGTTSPPG